MFVVHEHVVQVRHPHLKPSHTPGVVAYCDECYMGLVVPAALCTDMQLIIYKANYPVTSDVV